MVCCIITITTKTLYQQIAEELLYKIKWYLLQEYNSQIQTFDFKKSHASEYSSHDTLGSLMCYQDTPSCVSSQESHVAHKYSMLFIYRNRKLAIFNHSYLYNHYANFYQIHIFYALHIHDPTYQS